MSEGPTAKDGDRPPPPRRGLVTTVERTRWTDDRLDDMARQVEKNSTRQDATQNLVAALDLQVIEIQRARRTEDERRFTFRLAVASLLLGQIIEVALILLKVK